MRSRLAPGQLPDQCHQFLRADQGGAGPDSMPGEQPGAPFEVGTSALITNAASGVLFLGINDNSFSGNSGSWNVNIKLGGL